MDKTKTLVISGGSTGLGLAVIQQFLQQSWRVILLSRNNAHVLSDDPNLILINCNHTIECLKHIEDKLLSYIDNGVDLLINNAGYGLTGALESMTDHQILAQMQVNFFSHVYLTKMVIPYLRKSHGKIFNISSVLGMIGCPFYTMYCASKHAMEGFSEALYYELKPQNISCSIIVPGRYHTGFGKNMETAKTRAAIDAIYADQYHNFSKLKQLLMNKKANSPDNFAKKLSQLATKNKLPPRITIDFDCKVPCFFKKYLPSKLFVYIQNLFYAKFFNKKVTL